MYSILVYTVYSSLTYSHAMVPRVVQSWQTGLKCHLSARYVVCISRSQITTTQGFF